MNLQDKVSSYAEAEGVTREAIASEIGVSRSSVFNKGRGDNEFSLGEAFRLSRLLGVSLDDFHAMVEGRS